MVTDDLNPHFWIGRLSGVIAASIRTIDDDPRGAQRDLDRELKRFLRSDCASEELREMLKVRGK